MNTIKLFESKNIRSVWNEADEKWYFVVEDVMGKFKKQDSLRKTNG